MSRVLIVDDEPDILLMLRVNLEADGFETSLAADGETALARLDEGNVDVVLLDVMMPVMDGWGVLGELGGRSGAPRVIVVSARSSERDRARALELGAAAFVAKPFSPSELSNLVTRVIGMSSDEVDAQRSAELARYR
ncbi:MAG TPA: response regulator [Acidimicrobiales bacterium]|nr:response regulator [Acidimicrobiales bacterium]